MDYTKAIPVLTQLDYWTFLVELLDIAALTKIENHESRAIMKELKGQLMLNDALPALSLIHVVEPCKDLDLVYMSLNSILDFLFEAFKRDSQLAALLVKTTRLMDSVFHLVKNTLDQYREDCMAASSRQPGRHQPRLRLKNKGLLTVFVDKVVKIMHIAMLHPQDYSVDLLSKFIFEKPIKSTTQEYPELQGHE